MFRQTVCLLRTLLLLPSGCSLASLHPPLWSYMRHLTVFACRSLVATSFWHTTKPHSFFSAAVVQDPQASSYHEIFRCEDLHVLANILCQSSLPRFHCYWHRTDYARFTCVGGVFRQEIPRYNAQSSPTTHHSSLMMCIRLVFTYLPKRGCIHIFRKQSIGSFSYIPLLSAKQASASAAAAQQRLLGRRLHSIPSVPPSLASTNGCIGCCACCIHVDAACFVSFFVVRRHASLSHLSLPLF